MPRKKKETKETKKKIEGEEKEEQIKGKILPIQVEEEMKSSYIDYAMSVIAGRALPDVRDGLKPVHRRILYAMDELGLHPTRPHKKSARVVGEVLGKYHPHGDTAVYDAMVRMAQDFSLRAMLVDGQGNFGSLDGDRAAAMRYTEARLSPVAIELLADIDKETVPFTPNFDDSLEEPAVLPAKYPNLLVNGSSGIAVGMATNIPPHNLGEVVNGIVSTIDNPEIEIKEIMKSIPGPDFPTGALICGREGIRSAYETGRGIIPLRARVNFEEARGGKEAIIVTEIPYQVNKAQLVIRIAELVKAKKITGIADLRDESDRKGMRIYIELKRDANRDIILNQLYENTDMHTTFGINIVALVNGEPKTLNLKQVIDEYIKYREEVVTKRTQFDLKKAEHEAHILAGLRIALKNLDAVIKLIRASKNVDEARNGLMEGFNLTKIQAQAILDMRLQRLTALERGKIEEEHKKLKELIAELKVILASRERVLEIIKEELRGIKKKYDDGRRSEIVEATEEMVAEDLIPDVETALLITRDGFVKRLGIGLFHSQLRGGKGVAGMTTREEDSVEHIFVTTTHKNMLFFTNKGKVYRLKVYEIPEAGRAAKGTAIANLLNLAQGEVVTSALTIKDFSAKNAFLVMATRNGMIKKTELSAFANIRRSGIISINLKGDDELRWVHQVDGQRELAMAAESGLIIRFSEKDVRPMGRTAAGVKGVTLRKGDHVISLDVVREGADLLLITKSGFGKRTRLNEYRLQRRGGKGMTAIKVREKDLVAKARLVDPDDELLIVTASGTISRQQVKGISTQGRYAKGVRIQRMKDGDRVVDLARVVKEEEKV